LPGLWRVALLAALAVGCRAPAPPAARHLVLVTIDTLRADRVGAYGYGPARTPRLDGLAGAGVRFDAAFTVAPLTLPAHASILTGRRPPGHGARHNGMVMAAVPTLATVLDAAGFATGAFVAAFPLDRRFGLTPGFDVYGDRLPRGADGRPANERPGRRVVDEALAWWQAQRGRTFLWVHLFEPHAPYGDAADRAPVGERYDAEIAEADRQLGRLLDGLGARRPDTLVVVAADHGEAFGEHGEIGHSLFVYDTTLRVPLVVAGPGVPVAAVVAAPVSLIDLMPTALARLAVPAPAADGVDLSAAMAGAPLAARSLYAESFAPLLDFGWSPLRSLRDGTWKYIAAPRPELYDMAADAGETRDRRAEVPDVARRLAASVAAISGDEPTAMPVAGETARRLQSLGYVSARSAGAAVTRADPKDRREVAARLAAVTSGEVTGPALEPALRAILADDAGNPQALLRLGVVLAATGRCGEAEGRFADAIAAGMPTADAHLGLAGCLAGRGRVGEALEVLGRADAVEPGNPVVLANRGLLLSDGGRAGEAVPWLARAVELDPDFHQARFGLAIALARDGQRAAAATEARTLLTRLDPAAPQRAEVARLVDALK